MANEPWYCDRRFLLELFAFTNLGFLAIDIYSAHMVNDFGHWAEWVPFFFSLGSPVLLLPVLVSRNPMARWSRVTGLLVGWLAVIVGIAGLFYHLNSQFFALKTLASLVYTAPFVAPLAYTGIGFLLLLNRMEHHQTKAWGIWIVVMAHCGFIGNFLLSVFDHAQNGFFHWAEWIPVVASAFAVSFLGVFYFENQQRRFAQICMGLMVIQLIVGILGFYYHFAANIHATGETLRDKFVFGAPIFAPLLFANLALLAALGIWDVMAKNKTN